MAGGLSAVAFNVSSRQCIGQPQPALSDPSTLHTSPNASLFARILWHGLPVQKLTVVTRAIRWLQLFYQGFSVGEAG